MGHFHVRRAAVLGAGVMGAQIAAHFANAGIPVTLFELAGEGLDRNAPARKAIEGLGRLEPAPLAAKWLADAITPANYDEHLPLLAGCDLVVEAIAERLDWKKALYAKVAPHLAPHAVFASNTSGLSITALAETLPESVRSQFCGVHFFNPPRYMRLVELIAAPATAPAILDTLEAFITTQLGKGVVRAKDTPNFVANRVGVFSMLATLHHTTAFGLGFDEVDALTGPAIGRAKSATYRTADVVGLDTLAHVVRTLHEGLPNDPWHRHYQPPGWLAALIAKGALGQKTRGGIYVKRGKDIHVLDVAKGDYRPAGGKVSDEVQAILAEKSPAARFAKLRACAHPQAQFLWAIFRDVFHYCAVHLGDIAFSARDIDLAIRWGFGWKQGPFETWQAAGWEAVAGWVAEDIAAGRAMASVPLPKWVTEGRKGVHDPSGSFSPLAQQPVPRSALPVYARQRFPERLLGEAPAAPGETVWENDGLRVWHDGDGMAVASIRSKMHTLGSEVLSGLQQAVRVAEKDFSALVIWQEAPFAVGANLKEALAALQSGRHAEVDAMIAEFQRTSQCLKYSLVPTVAAVDGLALGGGCEFVMHAQRVVATLESYIGLVEAGVGLLPAGGGLKELAQRVEAWARGGDGSPELARVFRQVALGEVSKSAHQARDMGYLRPADVVITHPAELLHVAKAQARAMAEAGFRPSLPPARIPVAGRAGLALLQTQLVNMQAGGFISEHDFDIGTRIATILCGGDVDAGSLVDEQWLLELERRHFMELARTDKTQARIAHMLSTGKPLRN